jgi:hypothetical protein
MFFSPPLTPAADPLRLSAARYRAQALFLNVLRLEYDGDLFAPERLHLLQLLRAAMGVKRTQAGALLTKALDGNTAAEAKVVDLLARVAYDAA